MHLHSLAVHKVVQIRKARDPHTRRHGHRKAIDPHSISHATATAHETLATVVADLNAVAEIPPLLGSSKHALSSLRHRIDSYNSISECGNKVGMQLWSSVTNYNNISTGCWAQTNANFDARVAKVPWWLLGTVMEWMVQQFPID